MYRFAPVDRVEQRAGPDEIALYGLVYRFGEREITNGVDLVGEVVEQAGDRGVVGVGRIRGG